MRVENIPYGKVQNGEVSGSTTSKALPSVECSLVMIKAVASNAGEVYLGGGTVTVVNTTTDTTSGLELRPGDSTGWIPVSNLNVLSIICDAATDDITYLALA